MAGLMPMGAPSQPRKPAKAQRGLAPPKQAEPTPEVIRQAAEIMKQAGRYEDEEIAHVAPGEMIIPNRVQEQFPDFMPTLRQMFVDAGLDPDRYIVADTKGPNHKITGLEEFFSEGDGPNGMGSSEGGNSAGGNSGGSDGNENDTSGGVDDGGEDAPGAEASSSGFGGADPSDPSAVTDADVAGAVAEAAAFGGLSIGERTRAINYGLTPRGKTTEEQERSIHSHVTARHEHNPTPQQRAMNRATYASFTEENPNVVGLARALATIAGFAVPGVGLVSTVANGINAITGQPSVSYGLTDVIGAINGEVPDVSVGGLAPSNSASPGRGSPSTDTRGGGLMPQAGRPRTNPRTGAQEFNAPMQVVTRGGVTYNFGSQEEANAWAAANPSDSQSISDATSGGQSLEQVREQRGGEWNAEGGGGYNNAMALGLNDPTSDPDNPTGFGGSSPDVTGSSSGTGSSQSGAQGFPPAGGAGGTNGTTTTTTDRLNAILGSNSPLMQRAASQGHMLANRRGLLNASMAAGAAQAAMVDAATPLALQEGQVASAEHQQGRQISSNEYMQGRDIASQQYMQANQIAHEQYMQLQNNELQILMQQSDIDSQELMQERDIQLQEWLMSEDSALQLALQEGDIASDHWIAQLDADTRAAIANLQVGASDREKIGAASASLQQQYNSNYQAILNNPDLPADQRETELTHIRNVLLNGISLIEQTYGVELTWDGETVEEAA